MACFDENIVRQYFELNGFGVRQLCVRAVCSRRKAMDQIIRLLIYKPSAPMSAAGSDFQLFSADMASIRRAIVVLHSWQHTSVTPAILKNGARLLDLLKKEVLNRTDDVFAVNEALFEDAAAYQKIVVLPRLPMTDPERSQCIALFKEQGVDGVIAFSTILEDLLRHVEVNHNYHQSELLQFVRVLKMYDMVQAPQMQLF